MLRQFTAPLLLDDELAGAALGLGVECASVAGEAPGSGKRLRRRMQL
jgi:hypothetical protein